MRRPPPDSACGGIRASVLAAALLLGATPLRAQMMLNFHGYAKNIGIRSSSTITNEAFFLDVGRYRAVGLVRAGKYLAAEAWLDTEVLFGSFLDTDEFALTKEIGQPQWLDLNWPLATAKSIEVHQQLFRAFATVYAGPSQLTIGRQRIAWGTGFAWNPTDIINPFNPGAIELGERAGVDAAYATMQMSTFSRIELVATLTDGRSTSTVGARASTNIRAYDISAMAAAVGSDWVVGADFAGYLGGAGLRGEAAYSTHSGAVRTVFNADYSFATGLYALIEVYFNGEGDSDWHSYGTASPGSSQAFSLGRHYAAFSLSASLTPLVSGVFYGLANLNDRSALVGPSLAVSLRENLELAASTYFFMGGAHTEYGARHHVFFTSLQWYY